MRFVKRLFCCHYWVNRSCDFSSKSIKVGMKDWRTDESWWQCRECHKVKVFKFGFIPLNYEGN